MMSAAPQRPFARAESGYSLVELLIVLALLGVLSVALVSSLQFGARVWDVGERRSLALREVSIAQARLRTLITDAYPSLSLIDPAHPHVNLEGEQTRLTLLAFDPAARRATRSRITIEATGAPGSYAVQVRSAPELVTDSSPSQVQEETLVSGVADIGFGYLADGSSEWRREWRNEQRLPRLVLIRASFPDGDGRVWTDLIVAPRLAADVACVFDALSKSCRGR